MSKLKKLSAERLAEIRKGERCDFYEVGSDHGSCENDIRDLLAHCDAVENERDDWKKLALGPIQTAIAPHCPNCDALAAENQVLREALAKIELAPNYVSLGEVQDWARTALEKTR